jgi:hypothetical protein
MDFKIRSSRSEITILLAGNERYLKNTGNYNIVIALRQAILFKYKTLNSIDTVLNYYHVALKAVT